MLSKHPPQLKSFAWVLGSILLSLILVLATIVAIQGHQDRVLERDIERTSSKLQLLGGQIADIKDAHLASMNDYIGAYAQIAPLENDYDHQLEKLRNLYVLAQERSQKTVKIPQLRSAYHPKVWENMSEILAITSQLSDIIKRQASVVHEMASLPEGERLRFWHEQFLPLEAREHVLREELLVVGRRMSPQPESQ